MNPAMSGHSIERLTGGCSMARLVVRAGCLLACGLLLLGALTAQQPGGRSPTTSTLATKQNVNTGPADTKQSDAKASASQAITPPGKSTNSAKATDAAQSAADVASESLAPVVYRDDQLPGPHGYQYTFLGNAFFVNEQGYLLTVAHVLDNFVEGSQPPYILVSRPNAPPRLLPISVIAKDPAHDVAILRATQNPFATPASYSVAFVALSSGEPIRGEAVLALSRHPKQAQYAQTYDLPREDASPGTVLSFESTQLAKSAPPAEVFLLSHPVVKGQSGSPVMDLQTHAAIGLVEGIWLRATSFSLAPASAKTAGAPGAAIPIQYALALLKENRVSWHAVAPLTSAPPGSSLP